MSNLPNTFQDALAVWKEREIVRQGAERNFTTAYRNAFLASRMGSEYERRCDADTRVVVERLAAQLADVEAEEARHWMLWLRGQLPKEGDAA